jgi:squalene synthase HpnC
MRPHVAAVYAFARIADDIADEGHLAAADRRARLDAWGARLHAAIRSNGNARADTRDELVSLALAHSIRSLDLPVPLFDDLLSAFGQDTMTSRYASWAELLDYCRRSANPIGRLVLRIAGHRDGSLDRASDALCTALQLTNFWQDFGRDWRAGRLYVPAEVREETGASERDLTGGRLTDAWGRAIERCVRSTREHFAAGRVVCDRVRGRLGLELRLTWVGGAAVLDRVERRRFELLDVRPTLAAGDLPPLLWRAATWRGGA